MTALAPHPARRGVPRPTRRLATASPGGVRGRDRSVDLVRAGLLVWVVVLHGLMVGAWAPGGVPTVGNAMEGWDGFDAMTWVGQVMPLFFVLAGFSAAASAASVGASSDGASPRDAWAPRLGRRMLRLVPGVAAAAAAVTACLALLAAGGLAPSLLAEAGFRSAQPLWFLAVFALCTALSPVSLRLHAVAPRATLAALVAASVLIDALRAASENDALGLANMAFVWLALHQAGFLLNSPSLLRQTPHRLVWMACFLVGTLALLVAIGVYPPNLLDAMTPPTAALLLLGAAQLCLFQAVRARINAAAWPSWLNSLVDGIGSRAMTVYAWHLPLMVAMAGVSLALFGAALPRPASPEWWATRPGWFALVGLCLTWLVRRVGALERDGAAAALRLVSATASGRRGAFAVAGAACAAVAPLLVLVLGGCVAAWVLGTTLLVASVIASARAAAPATAPASAGVSP